jgi:hypothetical protein
MKLPNTIRECREERACLLHEAGIPRLPASEYDPSQTSEEELLIAKQLIEAAFIQRGIIITHADLGVATETVTIPAQASNETARAPLPLPSGVISQFVVQ